MILQECRPHENIRYLCARRHFVGVCLPRPHCAEHAALFADSMRRRTRGLPCSNRVENVCQIRRNASDGVDYIIGVVIEGVFGTECFDAVEVTRTARRDDLETV